MSNSLRASHIAALAVGTAMVITGAAQARPVRLWQMSDLAAKSDVIVVGEITQITEVAKIGAKDNRWNTPLLQMKATVRALRAAGHGTTAAPAKGALIAIPFKRVDWEAGSPAPDGPMYPDLRAGEVWAFPLRRPADGKPGEWELIDEEDVGLLVPCARETTGGVGTGELGAPSLIAELAGAFVHGDDATLVRAAKYLRNFPWVPQEDTIPRLGDAIAAQLPRGDARWLTIAVFSQCASGIPHPTVAEMLAGGGEEFQGGPRLAALALAKTDRRGLEERFLREVLRCASASSTTLWGAGGVLVSGYLHDPRMHRLLAEELRADKWEAVALAANLLRPASGASEAEREALLKETLPAARRLLTRERRPPPGIYNWEGNVLRPEFEAAVRVIRDYGSQEDVDWLVTEFRRAQAEDRERYRSIWIGIRSDTTPRMVPFLRIVKDDQGMFAAGRRYCDDAAWFEQDLARHGVPVPPAAATAPARQ